MNVLVGVAPVEAEPPVYYADGERIELEIAPGLLTVGRAPGSESAAEILASLGLEASEAEVAQIGTGLWRVDLVPRESAPGGRRELGTATPGASSEGKASPGPKPESADRWEDLRERQRRVIERALSDPLSEWAYPAHRNPETGTVLLLTSRIIVATDEELGERELVDLLPTSVRLVRSLRSPGQYLLELTSPRIAEPLETALRLMEEEDWVRWAEPDFIQQWRRQATPNDPLFSDQWHLENTGQGGGVTGADGRLPGAWDTETGDGTVVVAVLDDGVQLDHPDLPIFTNPGETADGNDSDSNGFVDDLRGWDFFDGDNDPDPCSSSGCSAGVGSHGTAVAGVAAAAGDNATGVTGACQDCLILPLRIADHGTGSFTSSSNIADAIDYAAEMADILNNSWGGGSPSSAITTAIQNADANGRGGLGSPVLFSSGNSASGYGNFLLTGIPSGTWTFTWTYVKDASVTDGFDTVWIDDVIFPDNVREDFEGCSGLPTDWSSSGDASWFAVDDQTRARSRFGGHCSIRAGSITHNESTSVSVTKTFASSGDLRFSLWRSCEPAGPLTIDDPMGPADCSDDYVELTAFDGNETFGPFFRSCGTWSNQGRPLLDGVVSYPASVNEAIAVGAATNFDTRSDYSQWEADELDFLCHSSGGTLGITTTDLTGTDGYDDSSYTDAFDVSGFGGTSSASPLCAGIAGLILSMDAGQTSSDVRSVMQASTRKIGDFAYSGGRNAVYGFGAVAADLAIQALTPNATIVVEKRTIPDGDSTQFSFTGDLAGNIADDQQLSSAVVAGSYSTTESVPSGWSLEKVVCDDGDSTGDVGSASATFEVSSGETVTCLFLDCSDAADTTRDLSGETVTTGNTEVFEACDTLTADNFEVQDGATVTFRAGRKIVLEDAVAIGGTFRAVIAGSL